MIETTIDIKTTGVFRQHERAEIERTRQKRKDRIKNKHEGQETLIKK